MDDKEAIITIVREALEVVKSMDTNSSSELAKNYWISFAALIMSALSMGLATVFNVLNWKNKESALNAHNKRVYIDVITKERINRYNKLRDAFDAYLACVQNAYSARVALLNSMAPIEKK